MIILTKLPLTNWMKNNSHWKFKAQHNHIFIAVFTVFKVRPVNRLILGFLQKKGKKNN